MKINKTQFLGWGGVGVLLALLAACGGGGQHEVAASRNMVKSLDEAPDGPPGWYSCSSAVSANLRAMEKAGVEPEKISCKALNTNTGPDYCFEMLIQVPPEQVSQAVEAGFQAFVPREDVQLNEIALCASNKMLMKSVENLKSGDVIPYSYIVTFFPSTTENRSPLTTVEDYFRIHGKYPPIPPFGEHHTGQDKGELAKTLGLRNGQVHRIFDSINAVHAFMNEYEAEMLRKDPRVMDVSQDMVVGVGDPLVEPEYPLETGLARPVQ